MEMNTNAIKQIKIMYNGKKYPILLNLSSPRDAEAVFLSVTEFLLLWVGPGGGSAIQLWELLILLKLSTTFPPENY